MFLHYMARYLSIHNESIYERTNIFDSYKPLDMRKFMELLDELLILNVYGNEDDSEEETEVEPQLQASQPQTSQSSALVLSEHTLKYLVNCTSTEPVQQQDNYNTPKGRRCSRRSRNQRIEKTTLTTQVKKNIKITKRNNTTKKVKAPTTPVSQFNIITFEGHKESQNQREDPYLLWLTAVMLKRIDRCNDAVELLIRAIRLQPCYWGAWIELSTMVKDIKMVV